MFNPGQNNERLLPVNNEKVPFLIKTFLQKCT